MRPDASSSSLSSTFLNDGAGYELTSADLAFLRLDTSSVARLTERIAPLGMLEDEYLIFADELFHALDREGVTDADVRLQGSSAHLFSSWHKCLPASKEDIYEAIISCLTSKPDVLPTTFDVTTAAKILFDQWPVDRPRPVRRPFDSMNICKIDASPSDYDVQICSDQMINRVRAELGRLDLRPERITVNNSKYAFVEKRYSDQFFLYITSWKSRMSKHFGRAVTWALFPSVGPNMNASDPGLSSHFRESDWIIERADRGVS